MSPGWGFGVTPGEVPGQILQWLLLRAGLVPGRNKPPCLLPQLIAQVYGGFMAHGNDPTWILNVEQHGALSWLHGHAQLGKVGPLPNSVSPEKLRDKQTASFSTKKNWKFQ